MAKINGLSGRAYAAVPVFLLLLSCGNEKKETSAESGTTSVIAAIASESEFNAVAENSPNKLLVIDLYADWCVPCRILSPMLEKIAQNNTWRAAFYKVNIDKFPQIARSFGVRGIPHVAFMKNRNVIEALVGVQPEEAYMKVIAENASTP
jgi:thioredoxin 1